MTHPPIPGSSREIAQALQSALELHRAGRLSEAERLYRQVLQADTGNADALYLLGTLGSQSGQHSAGLELIDRALSLKPDHVPALNSRGLVLHALARYEEALHTYEQVLTLAPRHAEAWNNRGNALQALGRHGQALASYEHALALKPDYDEALYNRGLSLHSLGQNEEALASYDRALALRPEYAQALHNRGVTLQALGRSEEALDSYDRALNLAPDNLQTLCNRGACLESLGRGDDAVAIYDRAIALQPDHEDAHFLRGNALLRLGRYSEAIASYNSALACAESAVRASPNLADSWHNRARCLYALGRYEEAVSSYDSELAIRPNNPRSLSDRGIALYALNRHQEAMRSYDEALRVAPEFPEAHWNRSLSLLVSADFENGWPEYEWRWRCKNFPSSNPRFPGPRWLGEEDIAGKTVLLYAEQGLGDTLQFIRYVPAAASLGARVILQVHPALRSLLAGTAGSSQVIAQGEAVPQFDFHCPLLSLPLVFGTRLDSIPQPLPDVRASRAAVEKWQGKIPKGSCRKVGIVWSGSRVHANDANRSVTLQAMLGLRMPGVRLISLQQEARPQDEDLLRQDIIHFGAALEDFSDTAALVSLMDLVITVDTAVAHLAGTMGKPVWILLPFVPDWRWLLDREDSPWYPTARLFRQPRAGDWNSVIESVRLALSKWMADRR